MPRVPRATSTRPVVMAGFTALYLLALVGVALYRLQPPEAVPADAPPEVFSSGRALQHLQVIAAEPHPLGSPAHAGVRDYLLRTLKALGLEPELQVAQVSRGTRFARVQNIVARLRGTRPGKALLLVSHYDSVPNAPGATDDGAGVAALLETIRALRHHPPLKNDLIFLFTDGEELGLLGAKAFVEQHPWAQDVGLVLNFEGSGSRGQSIMFETSDGNGWLIGEFARAAPYPTSNSLSYEIYKRMPNDTDLSIFKRAGYAGLNFAYIDGRYDYHTLSDNVANLDERSLQHHGSYALALALHFGNLDLDRAADDNRVYFNTFGWAFWHYPQRWALPLAFLALVLYALAVQLALRRTGVQAAGVARGLLAFAVLLLTVPATLHGLNGLVIRLFEGDTLLLVYHQKALLAAFVLLALGATATLVVCFKRGWRRWHAVGFGGLLLLLAVWNGGWHGRTLLGVLVLTGLLYWGSRRGTGIWELSLGALAGWALANLAVSFWMPGASFLLTWPLLFVLPGLLVVLLPQRPALDAPRSWLALALFAAPGVLWFTQLLPPFIAAMGVPALGLSTVLVVALVGLLLPLLEFLSVPRTWGLPAVTGLLGAVVLLVTVSRAEYNARFRKPVALFYGRNADTGESVWVSTDPRPDAWTRGYLGVRPDTSTLAAFFPTATGWRMWQAQAPTATLPPPVCTVVHDSLSDSVRTLTLRIRSPRGAPTLYAYLKPAELLLDARVNGEPVADLASSRPRQGDWWRWHYYGLPEAGVEVTLRVRPSAPLEIRLVDLSYHWPEIPGFEKPPRPDDRMPRRAFSDVTVVRKTFRFAAALGERSR